MSSKRILALSAGIALLALLCLGIVPRRAETQSIHFSVTDVSLELADDFIRDVDIARAETLSYVIQAGEVLIFNLPGMLRQRNIDSYRIRSAPALSWLVKRSFFWRTLPKDAGEHEILFDALTTSGSRVDDVVVVVDVR